MTQILRMNVLSILCMRLEAKVHRRYHSLHYTPPISNFFSAYRHYVNDFLFFEYLAHKGLETPAQRYGFYSSIAFGTVTAGVFGHHYCMVRGALGNESAAAQGMIERWEVVCVVSLLSRNDVQNNSGSTSQWCCVLHCVCRWVSRLTHITSAHEA
jgi:hypothetical protein